MNTTKRSICAVEHQRRDVEVSNAFIETIIAKCVEAYPNYCFGTILEHNDTEAYNLANDDENQEETNSGDTIMLGIALCTFGSIALNCGMILWCRLFY